AASDGVEERVVGACAHLRGAVVDRGTHGQVSGIRSVAAAAFSVTGCAPTLIEDRGRRRAQSSVIPSARSTRRIRGVLDARNCSIRLRGYPLATLGLTPTEVANQELASGNRHGRFRHCRARN